MILPMPNRLVSSLTLALWTGGSYVLGAEYDHVTISVGTLVTIISSVALAAWYLNGRLVRIEQKLDDLPCQNAKPCAAKRKTP